MPLHEILCWGDKLAGIPQEDTAKRLSIHRNTVSRAQQRIATLLASKFDINEYRTPLYDLYNLWLKSIIANLEAGDSPVTIAMGKGLQLFVDKQVTEGEDLSKLSNDELVGLINRRLNPRAK
ncbi:MAG: hypothetical protein ABIH23_14475 [bacterium]